MIDEEGAARFMLESSGYTLHDRAIDVYKIAELWNLKIKKSYQSRLILDTIEIDSRKSLTRQRFDIAHELAHIAAFYTNLDYKNEQLINKIAAAILMPQSIFYKDMQVYKCIYELSSMYKVCAVAAMRRKKELLG